MFADIYRLVFSINFSMHSVTNGHSHIDDLFMSVWFEKKKIEVENVTNNI